VAKWDFLDKGFDYYVVAILGCQSSGKSTLLNLLFGTKFLVMEAAEGRTQTTQGVWMGRAKSKSDKEETLLVFDVEGTDSRERGEQAASFERKTSLFSLVLSEVLIVNMWHTDIGRYNAGNIALLKTVFELNLQLFAKNSGPKRHILFLIRDHVPKETPLDKLKGVILKDMVGIWDGLIKPPEHAKSKVEDFFDFSFTALPHKVLAEEEFYKEINVLRDRFVDPKNPQFVLGKAYKKDIPSDGFAPYAERIWLTVKENKDLDIPSQKEMLAMFRCDEISAEAFRKFGETAAPWKKILEKGELVEEYGKKATQAYNLALEEYDQPSSRYHPEVAAKKRAVLAGKLNDELYTLFSKQLLRLTEKTLALFQRLLQEALPKDGTAAVEFAKLKSNVLTSTIEYFQSRAQGSLLVGSDWSFVQEEKDIRQQLDKQLATVRDQQLSKLMKEMKTYFTSVLKPLDKILESTPDDLWERIRVVYSQGKQKVGDRFKERLQGFEVSAEEELKKVEEVQQVAFQTLRDKLREKAKYLDYLMNKRFGDSFNLDENKLPRRWKPTDDIATIFMKSREVAETLLEKFCILRLGEELDSVKYLDPDSKEQVDENLIILSHEEAQHIKDKFYKETEKTYLQALRDQENVNSATHVPMYVIVLILVLGFNEFLTVLTNPILLILTIFIGVGGYVIYLLNMGGPFRRVVESMLHTSLSGFQQWMSNQLNKHKGLEVTQQKKES